MTHLTDDVTHNVASAPELNASDRHRLLQTSRRRTVISILGGRRDRLTLLELAGTIVETEGGSDADDEAIERVASLLHHVDLPILAAADVVRYDPQSGRIDPYNIPLDTAGPR